MAASHAAELLQTEAEKALAEQRLVEAEGKIVNGDPATVLLNEAQDATLLALGSHGRRRTVGILLGTVAARVLGRDASPLTTSSGKGRNFRQYPAAALDARSGRP